VVEVVEDIDDQQGIAPFEALEPVYGRDTTNESPPAVRCGTATPTLRPREYPLGMWSWIGIVVGYAFMIGGFRVLGGVTSAMDALRDWGRSATGPAARPSSS
jgi:hypothetical protein